MTTAAPAAPVGGAAPAATSTTPAPAPSAPGAPPPKAPVAPVKSAAPGRGNDGRFLSKEGTQGAVPQGEPAAPEGEQPPAKKDPYRLKGKRKVYGEEVDFDLDEEAALTQLARLKAMEKRNGSEAKRIRAAETIVHLLQTDPARLFRELNLDPDAWAQQQLARVATRNAMSEEERRIADVEAERDSYKSKLEGHLKEVQAQKRTQETDAAREAHIQRYEGALKEAGLRLTHLNIYHMAEVDQLGRDDGIEYSPKELAAETRRRLGEITNEHLGALDGPGLIAQLGPERVKLILTAAISQYAKAPGIPGVETTPQPKAPTPGDVKHTSQGQLEDNLRLLRSGQMPGRG